MDLAVKTARLCGRGVYSGFDDLAFIFREHRGRVLLSLRGGVGPIGGIVDHAICPRVGQRIDVRGVYQVCWYAIAVPFHGEHL